jgi:hypothetical protein
MSFLQKLKVSTIAKVAVVISLAAALIAVGGNTTDAADLTANFSVLDAHFYSNDAKTREITLENGISANNNFLAEFTWQYESDTPIADGDTVKIPFGSSRVKILKSEWLPITDIDGQTLGEWYLENRILSIKFSGAAVGHYSLNGSIRTARNLVMNGLVSQDVTIDFPIGDKTFQFTKKASQNFGRLSDGSSFYAATVTNNSITWTYMSPGITVNELYKGNGQAPLSEKAIISDLFFENELSPRATSAKIVIYARAPIPVNLTDGTNGGGGTGSWYNITQLFTQVTQSVGQTLDEFRESIPEKGYGVYHDSSTGRYTAIAKLGKQPSDITYAEATGGKRVSYGSLPETVETMHYLDDPNNVANGGVAQFVVSAVESFSPLRASTTLSSPHDSSYVEEVVDEEAEEAEEGNLVNINSTARATIPVGEATATIIGEARLKLVDSRTKQPLANREFVLQQKDGDEWIDLAETLQKTDSDGIVEAINLTPGTSYRWIQNDFAEHYDGDYMIYRDYDLTEPISEFTMPERNGIIVYATNSREFFTITYNLGVGAYDSVIAFEEQYYGDPTPVADLTDIETRDGYTFVGWDDEVSEYVTGNATYRAVWDREDRRGRAETGTDDLDDDGTTPDSITPESVHSSDDNVEPPFTYDGIHNYVRILILSISVSLYFAPRALRAYRVRKYRK